ncbi:MAG: proline dehydrogenase family protein [Ktedonobacteraceae bacterium]|nr:proline dehydrogenase family protein [Ktedonobacteraceae bacterium]
MVLKDTLLSLSQNPRMRDFAVHNRVARSVARRFVAGEQLEDAIEVTRQLNRNKMQVALNLLGENVTDAQEAARATQDYLSALDLIKQSAVDANISVKLTELGLDLSREVCEQNLYKILESAGNYGIFVCIDMEGSAYTERTIDITLRAREKFEHVGTVIQTYLLRSKQDLARLIASGVRVRLVKGAYKEPSSIAYQRKSDVDRNFVQLMAMLLTRGNFPAIATHDEAIINAACKFIREHGIDKSAFEFQMLYGVRRDLQEKLVAQGYFMRIFVPYGAQWYPYLMRRMAERPANLMFVLSNVLR